MSRSAGSGDRRPCHTGNDSVMRARVSARWEPGKAAPARAKFLEVIDRNVARVLVARDLVSRVGLSPQEEPRCPLDVGSSGECGQVAAMDDEQSLSLSPEVPSGGSGAACYPPRLHEGE
jgi:hypothetical protein